MIRQINFVALICCAFFLTACVTGRQGQPDKGQLAVNRYNICIEQIVQSHDYEPLVVHIPRNLSTPTIEQLSNDKKPNKREVDSLKKTFSGFQFCRQNLASDLAAFSPPAASIFISRWQKLDEIVVALTKQKMSWGEATLKAKEITIASDKELMVEQNRLFGKIEQLRYQEIQRQQQERYLNAQQHANTIQQRQNQQLIDAVNRPNIGMTTTTCNRWGDTVRCTSN